MANLITTKDFMDGLVFDGNTSVSFTWGEPPKKSPTPERVTYNGTTTIVFWSDNTKTMVKCGADEYDREIAVAMAVAHKLFGSKSKFKKFAANGYVAMTVEEEAYREEIKEAKKRERDEADRQNNLF